MAGRPTPMPQAAPDVTITITIMIITTMTIVIIVNDTIIAIMSASVNVPLLRLQSSEGNYGNVSRSPARTQVLPQAQELQVCGSGTCNVYVCV